MDEFDLIARYLVPLAGPEGLGLLDDAALYTPPAGYDLVLTQDTLVEGVHFPDGHFGADTAARLMLTNLSDLAAKGAAPVGYLLSVAWPKHLTPKQLQQWTAQFSQGLKDIQDRYSFSLFGGDTVRTSGPMTVTATLIGQVPSGHMIKRSGAKPSDDIWVTGHIGDAHLGLLYVQDTDTLYEHGPSPEALELWKQAYYAPVPKLAIGAELRAYASACADVSDGLLADANHIAVASHVELEIVLSDIPISDAAQKWVDHGYGETGLLKLASGGDDYELIFTAPETHRDAIRNLQQTLGVPLARIGKVNEGSGLKAVDRNGDAIAITKLGYNHV